MIKKISQLFFSLSAIIVSLAIFIFVLKSDFFQGKPLIAKSKYEVPRKKLAKIRLFAYKDLLGLYDPIKGQIYFYKDNIYVKTFRIAEPGANLIILY